MAKKSAAPVQRNKRSMSFWVSEEAQELLKQLAEKMGVPQSSVFELAIRALAKKEKLQ